MEEDHDDDDADFSATESGQQGQEDNLVRDPMLGEPEASPPIGDFPRGESDNVENGVQERGQNDVPRVNELEELQPADGEGRTVHWDGNIRLLEREVSIFNGRPLNPEPRQRPRQGRSVRRNRMKKSKFHKILLAHKPPKPKHFGKTNYSRIGRSEMTLRVNWPSLPVQSRPLPTVPSPLPSYWPEESVDVDRSFRRESNHSLAESREGTESMSKESETSIGNSKDLPVYSPVRRRRPYNLEEHIDQMRKEANNRLLSEMPSDDENEKETTRLLQDAALKCLLIVDPAAAWTEIDRKYRPHMHQFLSDLPSVVKVTKGPDETKQMSDAAFIESVAENNNSEDQLFQKINESDFRRQVADDPPHKENHTLPAPPSPSKHTEALVLGDQYVQDSTTARPQEENHLHDFLNAVPCTSRQSDALVDLKIQCIHNSHDPPSANASGQADILDMLRTQIRNYFEGAKAQEDSHICDSQSAVPSTTTQVDRLADLRARFVQDTATFRPRISSHTYNHLSSLPSTSRQADLLDNMYRLSAESFKPKKDRTTKNGNDACQPGVSKGATNLITLKPCDIDSEQSQIGPQQSAAWNRRSARTVNILQFLSSLDIPQTNERKRKHNADDSSDLVEEGKKRRRVEVSKARKRKYRSDEGTSDEDEVVDIKRRRL